MAGKLPPTIAHLWRAPKPPSKPLVPSKLHTITDTSPTDEPRRSGRATKGQHTKNLDDADAPQPPQKTKGKAGKQGKGKKGKLEEPEPEPELEEEEEEAEADVIRCVCGITEESNHKRAYVACDKCEVWQHNDCMQLDPKVDWESVDYYCEQCKPENHVELLAAMARGEKPWLKKGKRKSLKGGTAKSRPSEVPSVKSEDAGTPKPSQPAAEEEPSTDKNNAQTTNGASQAPATQPTPAETPAQSKRKRTSEVKDGGPVEKRRKSSVPETPVTLPEDRRILMETMKNSTLKPLVGQLVKDRTIRIPDNQTELTYCEGVARQIDEALVLELGPMQNKESPYFVQYQKIAFNIKKNPDLLLRLLTRAITPEDLAKMTSTEMLDKKRQIEDAKLREAAEKQSVMVHEEGPRIRKTHKGDEYIGGDEAQRERSPPPPPIHRSTSEADGVGNTATGGSPSVELPHKDRQPLKLDTVASPPSPKTSRQQSGNFNIDAVWSSVGSPPDAGPKRRPSEGFRRQSSITVAPPSQGPGKDEDIDRLLQDDEQTSSPTDFSSDPTIAWSGYVGMHPMASAHCVGRHVAGADIGQKIAWRELIPERPEIRGRIDPKKANEYIASLRDSTTTDLAVLNMTPVNDHAFSQKANICNYFIERDRWGVVHEVNLPRNSAVRDIYIVPIKADEMQLPVFLDMLEHCTISSPPGEDLLLMVIIARTASPQPSAEATPVNNGPGATPNQQHPSNSPFSAGPGARPNQPQFSPVVGQVPYGSTSHFSASTAAVPALISSPLAESILGPLLHTSVAQQVLKANVNADEKTLRNLKDIMDTDPSTRDDMQKLMEHLARQAPPGT